MRWPGRTATGIPAPIPLPEERLQKLLAEEPAQAWRAFIDAETPMLLAAIEHVGLVDRDEAMEVYVRVCERLAANNYAALRQRDPSLGSRQGWLAVIVKRAAVDWVRSRAGRRRLFAGVRGLDRFHQRLFELFYWEGRPPAEAAELLQLETKQDVGMAAVFAALERIDSVLTARHRSELLSTLARHRPAVPLEGDNHETIVDPPAADLDPEALLRARERGEHLARALASLPAEDAVIVSLKFVDGLTRTQIQRFLRLPELTEHRVRTIVATLRARLAEFDRGAQGRSHDEPHTTPTMTLSS